MKRNNYLLAALLVMAVVFVAGCTAQPTGNAAVGNIQTPSVSPPQPSVPPSEPPGNPPAEQPPAQPPQPQGISLSEVAKHNTQQDCWLAINGKVYDVTGMINNHPGGLAILQGCGKDATTLFETKPMGSGTPHSQNARNLLPNFYKGELA